MAAACMMVARLVLDLAHNSVCTYARVTADIYESCASTYIDSDINSCLELCPLLLIVDCIDL